MGLILTFMARYLQFYSCRPHIVNTYPLYRIMNDIQPTKNKRISIRIYKPLNKPAANINSLPPSSPLKNANGYSHLRQSYSPNRKRNKEMTADLRSDFNVCTSKNVFVFTRKEFIATQPPYLRSKENYRRQMTEQVFCWKTRTQQAYYRPIARSKSSPRSSPCNTNQTKRSISQTFSKSVQINPEPWQMKGESHDLESLF